MPTLQDILNWVTPNEASAEVIPTTPGAKQLLTRGLSAPGKMGDAIRLAHAQPEKVYLSDQPTLMQRLTGGSLGSYQTSPMGKQSININTPMTDWVQKQTGRDEGLETLAHETGHFLGQNTGLTGNAAPTGIAPLDYLYRAFMFLTGKDLRIPTPQNEAVADSISGLDNSPNPTADQVIQQARSRVQ